jgi:hypothetical protein
MVAGVKILKSAETEASGGALDNVTRAQQTVLQPGAADKPWWVDSQTGRLWASSGVQPGEPDPICHAARPSRWLAKHIMIFQARTEIIAAARTS